MELNQGGIVFGLPGAHARGSSTRKTEMVTLGVLTPLTPERICRLYDNTGTEYSTVRGTRALLSNQ